MNDSLGLVIMEEKVVVSSRDVARVFEKEHHKVLRDIRELECSEGFRLSNFGSVYKTLSDGTQIQNKTLEYLMTRDGFTLLAMGYTGPKAMAFKEAYIEAFRQMEEELRKRQLSGGFYDFIPRDYAAALRAHADEVERRELAEKQRDIAIRTKAEIGSRREATAMATASSAVRKVTYLEDRLGEGKNWKQCKAVPWVLDYFAPSKGMWSVLGKKMAALSVDMGYEVRKIEDQKYGNLNAYHVDVWEEMHDRMEADHNMMSKYRKELAS